MSCSLTATICFANMARSHHQIEYTKDTEGSIDFLINALRQGHRVVCPCTKKTTADKIYARVMQALGEDFKAKIYTSRTPCTDTDVNNIWNKFQLIIYTSSIDCGISFELNGYFYICICFFGSHDGPIFETCLQMLSRARLLLFCLVGCANKI